MFIQLQYRSQLDGEKGKNLGGLYLNINNIAAIRNDFHECRILMVDGTEYWIVQSIMDVMEKIIECQQLHRKIDHPS